jgi:hypothetical protein
MVLSTANIWQFVELPKTFVSKGLNTKCGQQVQNYLVSNYSKQGARRIVRLENLTVV